VLSTGAWVGQPSAGWSLSGRSELTPARYLAAVRLTGLDLPIVAHAATDGSRSGLAATFATTAALTTTVPVVGSLLVRPYPQRPAQGGPPSCRPSRLAAPAR
jgi:hypothetical protein